MIDTDAILYAFLTESGNALYSLVGTRIEYGQTPEGFDDTEAQVVFLMDDGDPYTRGQVEDCTYLFHCYGGTGKWRAANAVYQALRDRLHNVNMETVGALGVIMAMHADGTGEPLTHPGTKHKLIVGRFRGKFKEI